MLLSYPIVLPATHKLDFYVAHQAFNLLGMFKSPMMMMMLFGGGMVFLMPYLMVSKYRSESLLLLTTYIEKYGS